MAGIALRTQQRPTKVTLSPILCEALPRENRYMGAVSVANWREIKLDPPKLIPRASRDPILAA